MFVCVLSHSVVSDCLQLHGLWPIRLLCPEDFSVRNTGMGCHFFLQGIFLTQGLNPCLFCYLNWQAYSLPLETAAKPEVVSWNTINTKRASSTLWVWILS